MRRQKNASVMKKDVKALCGDETEFARQTFEKTYKGIVLEVPTSDDGEDDDDDDDTDIRTVTSVCFNSSSKRNERCWYARTDIAREGEACKASTEKYESAELNDVLNIKIASKGLGTYIKLFNDNEKVRMAFGTPGIDE